MPLDTAENLRSRGICVIVPTYNNAGTIEDVVRRAFVFCKDVFVVVDGSTDDTVDRLKRLENQPNIIELPENTGKGNALRAGFRQARSAGFAYAITLDGDGQHYPEDIPLFLEANRRHPGALIVGRRQGLDSVERSKSSSFANSFSNFWFFLQTLVPLKDTQTGYRLYPLKKLHGLRFLTSRYEAELELLVFSAWCGVRIVSQDVRVYYPPRDERVSHFRPIRDFARISVLNVVLCLLALVFGLPLTLLRWLFLIIKSFLTILLYAIGMTVFVTPGIFLYLKFGKKSEKKKERLHVAIKKTLGFALKFLGCLGNKYSLRFNAEENFDRPSIIICNHQSHLDLLPMLALTPKLIILTADWVWHNPLYGFIIREADYLPASRGLEAIVPRLRELVSKGYSIVVYPEGTRSPDCRIGRFHQGAFYLAEILNVDILPTVIYGTGQALPKHGRILRPWPIIMEVDKRVSPDDARRLGDSLKSRASYWRKYYMSRYSEIADKVEQTNV